MINKFMEEKRRRVEKARKTENAKNLAVGTAIGTAIGAVAGILFAPKSGKETREDISQKSKDVAENVRNTVNEQIEATKGFQEKVKSEIKNVYNGIKEKKDDIVDEIEIEIEELKDEKESKEEEDIDKDEDESY
ncbi:YtxH domain-containing protein [Tissierella praeacuta]|uniref:YtxH domain-containing protein n=1 Tax=Tissierella praeacuta TaxID=43131 RepID=UPI0033410589